MSWDYRLSAPISILRDPPPSRAVSTFSIRLPRQESTIAPDTVDTNRDTDPSTPEQRTWGPGAWILYWTSDVVTLSGWQKYASMISLGLDWRNALLATLVGSLCLAIPMILNGRIGSVNRIPFPIAIRASLGYYLSLFAIVSRAVIAMFWFGIQSWNGGTSAKLVIGAIWPSFLKMKNHLPASAGFTSIQMISYVVYWCFQFPFLFIHPSKLRPLFLIKGIFVPISAFAIMGWTVHAAQKTPGGTKLLLDAGPTVHGAAFAAAWLTSMTSVISGYSTLVLNIPDFTRYSKSDRAQYAQAPFIPFVHLMLAVVAVITASCTKALYGTTLWSPLDVIAKWDSRAAIFFNAIVWLFAQICVNVSANSISASNDISNIFPRYINIQRGQILVALVGYAVVLGPFAGIMCSDYYIIKKQKLDVPALYDPHGRYRFVGGVNWRAAVALLISIAPNLPGLAHAINTKLKIGSSVWLYRISWTYGFFSAVIVYLALSFAFPDKTGSIVDVAVHPDEYIAARKLERGSWGAATPSDSESLSEKDKGEAISTVLPVV